MALGSWIPPWGKNPDDGKGWANCADYTLYVQTFRSYGLEWGSACSWGPTFGWTDDFVYTSPVGSFKPNAWGLFDMIGNAWEWREDRHVENPAGIADGAALPEPSRIVRGGSWHSGIACGSARRDWRLTTAALPDVGFRVVLDFDRE